MDEMERIINGEDLNSFDRALINSKSSKNYCIEN
jgi:hypothetical protein